MKEERGTKCSVLAVCSYRSLSASVSASPLPSCLSLHPLFVALGCMVGLESVFFLEKFRKEKCPKLHDCATVPVPPALAACDGVAHHLSAIWDLSMF